jgi:S1-C subfamily serine protease
MYLLPQQLYSFSFSGISKSHQRKTIFVPMALPLLLLALLLFSSINTLTAAELINTHNVVKVMALNAELEATHGTGFILNNEGYVATNHHVAGNKAALFVIVNGQRVDLRDGFDVRNNYKNTNIEKNPWSSVGLDLAILKIKSEYLAKLNLQPVTLTSQVPRQGRSLSAIGYPGIAEKTLAQTKEVVASSTYSEGEIASIIEDGYWVTGGQSIVQLLHTVPIAKGNSGGPLFDECGRVVGVNTWKPVEQSKVYDKRGKEVGVSYVQNAAYGLASSINELIKVLGSQGISYSIDNSICLSRQELYEEDNKKISQILQLTLYIGGTAFIAVGLIFVYMLRNPVSRQKISQVVETYSRSLGRRSPQKARVNKELVTAKYAASNSNISQQNSSGSSLILDGFGPDHKRFRLVIPANLLYQGGLVVGREPDSVEYAVSENSVSRKHCLFFMRGNDLFIHDESSTNGTFVNGRQLNPGEDASLCSGAEVKLGSVTFKVIAG